MCEGWISIHRKMLDNPFIFNKKDKDYTFLWLYLLLNAAYKEHTEELNGKVIIVKRGQLITGRKSLEKDLNIDESKITRMLKKLESEHQIEQQTTTSGRLITIVNWTKYQNSEHPIEQQPNNERTTSEQQVNTIKQRKKETKKTNKALKDVSSELSAPSPEPETKRIKLQPAITFLLNDESEYAVTENDVETFQQLYPALDIMQELRDIQGWCLYNPKKRKTRSGAKRFMNGWLRRSQNSTRRPAEQPKTADKPKPNNKFNDFPQREHNTQYFDDLERRLLAKAQKTGIGSAT